MKDRLLRRLRRLSCEYVCDLLDIMFGEGAANEWLWEHTCFPMDIPSWEQIREGYRLACGVVTWRQLIDESEKEMRSYLRDVLLESSPQQPA